MTVRKDGESFEEYCDRRKVNNLVEKQRVRGTVVWDSSKKGTYIKARDGKIGTVYLTGTQKRSSEGVPA